MGYIKNFLNYFINTNLYSNEKSITKNETKKVKKQKAKENKIIKNKKDKLKDKLKNEKDKLKDKNNTIKNGGIKKIKYKKKKIPKALREQVWIKYNGCYFNKKCYVKWCKNKINCFNYDCGHDIPESKGGKTVIENLKPICRNCNLSMGNSLTIKEWNDKYQNNNSSCIIQ